jgi:hypothetical protein
VNITGVTQINEVSVLDAMGKEVLRFTDGTLNRVSLGTLPDGIYLVRVLSKEGIHTAKISLVK